MSDIAKAWSGIGEIKSAMTGLERRMNAYRKENTRRTPSDPVLDVSSVLSDRSTTSVSVDNVPRYVLRGDEENNDRRTSSPLKQPSARSSTNLFSDAESVSTIHSNTGRSAPRDPVKMQEGMMKLKEKIIRQKEMALSASQNNIEVRYLDPKNYDASKPAHTNNRDVRKRKKATAPVSETYKGFNEAQKVPKPVRKHVSIAPEPSVRYVPEQPRSQEPPRRKVAAAPQDKSAIITTSSWRQGAAITCKVLGNKTQETDTSSSSISVNTDTSTKREVAKPVSTAAKPVAKPKPKSKVTPKKEEPPVVTKKPGVPRLGLGPKAKPVKEALPQVKARHYNPTEVQKYIEKTKKQRKKAEAEQKLKDAKAEKEKEARLQELFNFQNKGMKKRGSISRSTPSPTKLRSDSGESSDKENSFVSPPSPPVQDPGPGKPPERVVSFLTQPQPSEGDITVTLEPEEPIILQGENKEPSPDLLPSYLQEKSSSDKVVYSEQRRRMEAIRATALALRKKIYDETNRLTEEASRANQLLRPLSGYEEYTAPGIEAPTNDGSPPHLTHVPDLTPHSDQEQVTARSRHHAGLSPHIPRLQSEDYSSHDLSSPHLTAQLDNEPVTDNTEVKEAWSEAKRNAEAVARDNAEAAEAVAREAESSSRDETLIEEPDNESELISTGGTLNSMNNTRNDCPWLEAPVVPTAAPEPFEFPLTADPYSIINIYARQRQREEERILSERKREDEREEDAARDLRKEIKQLERDKKREEEELAVMEAEVEREEERLGELRRRREERLNKSISVGSIDSYCSEEERDTRNTESLLHTTTGSDSDTPEVHTDYNFTPEHSPLKDISLVSATSAKKSLSFSDHDSVVTDNDSTLPIPAADNTGLYSPAALHRKLRGELARYDTYSLSLEHVNTLQHTQQHADAQQDTVAIASALRTEDTKHESEMAQLQEKLKRDMAEFQHKLNQVQTQTVLQRADLMNQQAETHAKTAQSVLAATDKMANTHEETNRVLVDMAKKVTETQEAIQRNRLTSPDNTKSATSAASYTPYTPTTAVPYKPSFATPYDTYTSVPQDVPETPTADRTLTTEKTLEQSEMSDSEDLSPTKDVSTDLLETPQRDQTDPLSACTPQSQYDDITESSPEKVQESFKALLPSESHRRRMSASEDSTSSQPRQASDSFTAFTMSQVHEYIKNESVRAKHQDTLLALREKALKEKTDVKLKWLEIKKRRIQRKGADDKMPPLLQKEKDILAALASEQEEIKKLQEVQRAAQAERKRMVYQQREINAIQQRTAKLRKRIKTAEHSNEDMPSDISDMSILQGGYDTDGSSVYDEDPRFKSLAEFNQRIQREGNEVKRLLDLALAEKKETEKIENEFGISSPSRLPRGIKPISNTSSATSTLTRDTVKLVSPRSSFESSTPLREGSVPPSPAYSVIEGDRYVASEVLEMEERVGQLKEELALKKAEARRLLKDEQTKKKEALRLQEQNLRKQISTVTNVIEKQKKQIHNKFRSPNSSPDKRHTTKRHSVKYSSDDSSVKSSVSEIKSSDRSFDKSSEISEYVSKEDVPSKSEISSEIVSANFDITVSSSSNKTSNRDVSEEIKTKISERVSVRSDNRSEVISENLSSEKVSEKDDDVISEDLSKNSYADISFNKLQNVKIMELEDEISIGDKTEDKTESHDESLGNVRSLNELETSDKAASESISSDKPSLFDALKDASALDDVASPDVTPPIAESPQPSLRISVDVLEDLSLSSGSLNDTDYSFKDIVKSETQSLHQQSAISEKVQSFASERSGTGLISQKSQKSQKSKPISELSKVTSYTDLSAQIQEDVSEEISEVSEDISEEVISGTTSIDGGAALSTPRDISTASKGNTKLHTAKLLDMEIERSLSEVSSAQDKSVSEKLAELESRYSRVSERASMGSYTLSFDEEDEKKTSSKMPDTMFTEDEEDLKSLLSNIDESLNKSSEILVKSATKSPEGSPRGHTKSPEGSPRGRTKSPEGSPRGHTKSPEGSPRGHTFSNLTALSSTTEASSDTGDTTKLSEAPDALTPMMAPSPPSRQPSPLDRLVSERSQSLRQTSFKMPSPDLESEVLEDLDLSVEAETADDVDDISLNQSLSDSKTMSELKDLCSPTPSNQTSKTLSHSGSESPVDQELLRPTIFSDPNSEETLADDRSSTISEVESYSKPSSTKASQPSTKASQPSTKASQPSTKASQPSTKASQPSTKASQPSTKASQPSAISEVESLVLSDEEEHPDNVTESIFQEMIRGAFEKMLKVRQDKRQKQLNSSPKYMERSPPGAEKRQELTLNDTFPDTELESALALARSVAVEEERSVMSPDLPPPPKITVQCNQQDTLAMATAVTQHLVKCVRNKRPCTLDTFTHCQHLPPNLTPSEQIQARTFQSLIYKTTVECFAEVNNEYNFVSSAVQDLPPWRPEAKRRPRPHWMRDLPPRLDLASVEHCLPGKVVSLVGLSEEHQRKYQHMENILTQEVRDEEAEWTDYDADELAVKFRLSDTIFECLLRETLAVYSAIDQREISS